MSKLKPYVVIPNWNGAKDLPDCLDSLRAQVLNPHIIIVDNGSSDNSLQLLSSNYPEVEVISLSKNHGFAGGVNPGIKKAITNDAEYVALLNNDAVADKYWLERLQVFLEKHPKAGIATSKILDAEAKLIDSTGEFYTIWGLSYPRGRGEPDSNKYDNDTWVFGASGGATMYRVDMFKQIGLFDEDFFAYYEDVDISFRAQLAGWKVAYVPQAVAYHKIGATSGKIKGFTTYHTLKNLPLLLWKNIPWKLLPKIWVRLVLAWSSFVVQAIRRRQFTAIFKAVLVGTILWPKKVVQRNKIQRRRKVSPSYIDSIIIHDLPPKAYRLRKLIGKKS